MNTDNYPKAKGCLAVVCTATASSLLFSVSSTLADEAIVIGGGYELLASQGQIEKNVQWVQGILGEQGLDTYIWYTDGLAPGPDVYYQIDLSDSAISPLARVFGEHYLDRQRFRNHTLDGVSGTTEAALLMRDLAARFNDNHDVPTLLIYNGHGSQSPAEPDGVSLDLWNYSSLDVHQLDELIGKRSAPLRYVFTQCYSGGFHRLIYDDPADVDSAVDGMRCGFTAESAFQLAEGCSASVETEDYRDYTTFFFAAIADRERDDTVLTVQPDLDNDGVLGLREAHLYALAEAHSSDIPRASSEQYLEDWQPWYLRWLPASVAENDRLHAKIYRQLAARLKLPLEQQSGRQLRAGLSAGEATFEDLRNQQAQLVAEEQDLQNRLVTGLFSRWPSLAGPYTGAFAELAERGEIRTINKWLNAQDELSRLIEVQVGIEALDMRILDQERENVQLEKLLHLRRLTRLEAQLEQYGSVREQAAYEALIECESLPLNVTAEEQNAGINIASD